MIQISLKSLFAIGLLLSHQSFASKDIQRFASVSGPNQSSQNFCRLIFHTDPVNATGILVEKKALLRLNPVKVKPFHPATIHSLFNPKTTIDKNTLEEALNFLVFGNPKSKENTQLLDSLLRRLDNSDVQLSVDIQSEQLSFPEIKTILDEPEYRDRLDLLHSSLQLPLIPMEIETHVGTFEYSGLRNRLWDMFIYSNPHSKNAFGMTSAWYALADRIASSSPEHHESTFIPESFDISNLRKEDLFIHLKQNNLHPALFSTTGNMVTSRLSILDFSAILILESRIPSRSYFNNAKFLAATYPELLSQKGDIPKYTVSGITLSLIQRLITYAENYRQYLLDSNPAGLVPIAEHSLSDFQKEADKTGQSLEQLLKTKLIQANQARDAVHDKLGIFRQKRSSDSFFTGKGWNTHFITKDSEESSAENLFKQLQSTLRYTEEAQRSFDIETIRKPAGPFSFLRGFIRRNEYKKELSKLDQQKQLHNKLNDLDDRIHQLKELSAYIKILMEGNEMIEGMNLLVDHLQSMKEQK